MFQSTPTYQWLFDGAGVALVTAIGTWLYHRYRKKSKQAAVGTNTNSLVGQTAGRDIHDSPLVSIHDSTVHGPIAGRDVNIGTYVQTTEPEDDDYHERPTPTEIHDSVEKVPQLLLKQPAADAYQGLKVRWRTRLSGIRVTEKHYSRWIPERQAALTDPVRQSWGE